MGENEVLIPIKFTIEDDKTIQDGINKLKANLQKLEDAKRSTRGNMDDSKEIQKSIDAVKDYIKTIEEARDEMAKLKDSVAQKQSLAESITDTTIYKGLKKSPKDIAESKASSAQRDLILQGTELINTMNKAADAANAEMQKIAELGATQEKAAAKVDIFKKAMSDFKQEFTRGFQESFGINEINEMIARTTQAVEAAQNAIESTRKTLDGKVVSVDPGATKELLAQFEIVDSFGAKLDEMITHYENFKQMITDGSITKELAVENESVADFRTQLDLLNKDVNAAIKILMSEIAVYEHEAEIAAQTARELRGNVVVKSAPREEVGHAEIVFKEAQERQKAEEQIQKEIAEREAQEKQLTKTLKQEEQERAKTVRKAMAEDKEIADYEKRIAEDKRKTIQKALADIEKAIANEIKAINKEISAVKNSASQYYYKLRAVKMLGFTLKQITSVVENFNKKLVSGATKALIAYSRLIPGVNALRRAFDKAHTSQTKLNKSMKDSSKHTKLATASLSKFVITTLKAVIGIRSLYMLLRKLRRAIGEGFESMAVQLEDVNAQLSSIVTSFNYMKASITAVVQPLLNALAPALEKIADAFEKASYYASSFFAVLTGQDYVYRAIKVQTDYAESLDNTAKSAKAASKELGKYDKLNVIGKEKDNTGGMQWEKVPLADVLKDWAEKFKDFSDKLFEPLITAWNKFNKFIINSWKYALDEILALGKSIARDFWLVWESDTVQRIFDNLAKTLGFIGLIVGNLAHNLKEAWDENNNGYRIFHAIAVILERVTEHIKDAAVYTERWSKSLTFTPLFTEIADVLQLKIVPAVEKVLALFEYLYEKIFLKIVKDFIEKGLPQLVSIFGTIVESAGIFADKIREALESNDTGVKILENAEALLQIIVDKVKECADKTKEWAENLNLTPLMSSLAKFLEDIKPLVQFIADTFGTFYTNVLLPFWKYLIEGNAQGEGGLPGTLEKLGEVIQKADWEAITENMHKFMDALEPFFELAWETLTELVGDLMEKILDFAGSEEFGTLIDKFKDWATNADPEELANKIEKFVVTIVGATAALKLFSAVVLPLITNWMTIVNFVKQNVMSSKVAELTTEIEKMNGTFKPAPTLLDKFKTALEGITKIAPNPVTMLETLSTKLGIMASPAGAVVSATGVVTALAGGLDMMSNGFSLGSEAVTIFGGVLTTVGLIIAGIAAWPAVIAGAIVVLIANLGAFGDDLLNWVVNGAEEIRKKIGEFFENLGHNIGVWVGKTIKNLKQALDEKLTELQKPENWLEFGKNILEGILAIFLLPGELWSWIKTAIKNFFDGFVKGIKEGFEIGSPSKKMEPYGEYILQGILEGIKAALKNVANWVVTNIFNPIMKSVTNAFGIVGGVSSKFKTVGNDMIKGLQTAVVSGISTLVSKLPTNLQKIIRTFTNNLSSNKLLSIGRNLISGLKDGIENGLSNLLSTVTNVCNDVINTFKDIFDIHSPSGVTEKFGKNLMQGFENGADEEADNDILPTEFADNFLDALTVMKIDAIDIVTSMIDEISAKMENLTFADNLSSKLKDIKIPDIAIGSVLPSNVEFKQSNTKHDDLDMKMAIQDAISEALKGIDLNSNKQPVVLQLDKRTIAEAVWDEEDKRYKQRGSFTPLY